MKIIDPPETIEQLKQAFSTQDKVLLQTLVHSILNVEPAHHLYALSQNIMAQCPVEVLKFIESHTDFFKKLVPYHLAFALHSAVHRKNDATFDFLLKQVWNQPMPAYFNEAHKKSERQLQVAWDKERVARLANAFYKAAVDNNQHALLGLLGQTQHLSYELVSSKKFAWFERCYNLRHWGTLDFMLKQGFITGQEPRILKILSKKKMVPEYENLIQAHAEKEVFEKLLKPVKEIKTYHPKKKNKI